MRKPIPRRVWRIRGWLSLGAVWPSQPRLEPHLARVLAYKAKPRKRTRWPAPGWKGSGRGRHQPRVGGVASGAGQAEPAGPGARLALAEVRAGPASPGLRRRRSWVIAGRHQGGGGARCSAGGFPRCRLRLRRQPAAGAARTVVRSECWQIAGKICKRGRGEGITHRRHAG